MDTVTLLTIVLVGLVILICSIGLIYYRYATKDKVTTSHAKQKGTKGMTPEQQEAERVASINEFLEFDQVKDNMIVRKNGTQYVMVLQCQGVNYDLMSEDEKLAIEEGFIQFLNTLRFPIQLYVQTRSLNLKDIIEEYRNRMRNMENDLNKMKKRLEELSKTGTKPEIERLEFEIRRKENVVEYGSDISEYIAKMSLNSNILQQKTYVIVSYYSAELGEMTRYSKDEIHNMCFSELYTRCQSVIRSLASAEVMGRILESEELAELLYVAYNRDDAELMQLSKVLDAEYDTLYSTGKDILEKQQEKLDEKIQLEAIDLATESIIEADKKRQEEMQEQAKAVEEKALGLIEQYKEQMDPQLYEGAKEEVRKRTLKNIKKKAV